MMGNIFVLTGAGVSAESGLGTFRDKTGEGIWARFDPMKLATPEGFERDPETVLAFYDFGGATCATPRPTPPISRSPGSTRRCRTRRRLTLVTQNIDNLHEPPAPATSSTCTASC